MKIGYYLGSGSVEGGGVGPFGTRVAEVLAADDLLAEEAVDLVFLCGSERISGDISWRHVPHRDELSDVVREEKLDLLHFPRQQPPVRVLDCPFTVTMHDVQELHHPEFFTAEQRRWRAINYLWAIRESAGIAVSFEHVKGDLIRYFDVEDKKVSVIPLPYRKCISDIDGHIAEKDSILSEFTDRKGRYFLYPAQTWKHKNHLRLIDAFEQICSERSEDLWLVCTGKKDVDHFCEIEKRLKASKVADRIVFSGIVAESTLVWLYKHALAVVIPSLYEAGSFPLIESMAYGTPVVCSSTTSLPETIGNSALVFDPNDPEEMAAKMSAVAFEQNFRSACVDGCSDRFEELALDSERSMTRTYIEFWKRALSGGFAASANDQGLAKWVDRDFHEKTKAVVASARAKAAEANEKMLVAQEVARKADARASELANRLKGSEAELTRMAERASQLRYSWSFRVGYYLLRPWKAFERGRKQQER